MKPLESAEVLAVMKRLVCANAAPLLAGAAFMVFGVAVSTPPAMAQVAGQSVNMVTGTQWPGGDPFLERQNEPSMAVSSRNPLHLLAGNNDYRTVDLPGVNYDEPTGDSWLGLFTSIDGGNVWQSVLVAGYPQDTSPAGMRSPLKAYQAGTDPTVRAGTNGLFYYSGLVFNRDASGSSAVFVARYIDDNNLQGANTIRYLDANIVASGDATHFIDKPYIAVDIPRPGSPTCSIPASATVPSATISAGRIYIAFTRFNGDESSTQSAIMFSYSNDCGVTWTTPQKVSGAPQTNQGATLAIDPNTGNVYIVWRVFKDSVYPDEIAGAAFQYQSGTLTQIVQAPISPFDQGTTNLSFRTNAFPSIAADASGRLYVAWSQRGSTSNRTTGGDARIQLITGQPSYRSNGDVKGMQFSGPFTVDPYQGRGHQIIPALALSSGQLTIAWYDLRNDDRVAVYTATGGGNYSVVQELPQGVVPQFSTFIADPSAPYSSSVWRHTVDVRATRASAAASPVFKPSIQVSQYAFGTPAFDPSTATNLPSNPDDIQQLEFNVPNLPIFKLGTVPFFGDYIDIAGSTFVPYISSGTERWRFNNLSTDPDHTHVVWTDNRNVVQPANGDWTNYTPVGSKGGTSLFDPTQSAPACVVGQTGIRNQDIYTATISSGLLMSSKGNYKQLSTSLTREFPVTIENPTNQTLYYRLTIQSQPTGGSASFLQFPVSGLPNPLTQLTVGVPALSSSSRSVFIQSSDPAATVSVNAVQTDVNNNVIPNGLTSSVGINNDVTNPNISNPNISNIEIYNPNISNPNISNPNISNPNISNPNISNPNISNPNISNVSFANPNISNPNISNPNISNPNISNPNISNPNISNPSISGEITDATYSVTNAGNTATSYAINLVQYQPPPSGITVQLIVSGVYLTPVANACTLAVQPHFVPILNVPNPTFKTPTSTLQTGPLSALTPTFSLQPGEQAIITLRVYDPNASTPAQALQDYNPVANIAPVISTQAINTGAPIPPPTVTVLSITTTTLPAAAVNINYSVSLQASGGSGVYTWTAPAGSLPPGLTLQTNGVLSGIPTVGGTYPVSVQVTDTSGQTVQRSFVLTVSSLGIGAASLPTGQYNSPYSFTLSASGGTPPYHWSIPPSGTLPAGLTLNPTTGALTGAPAEAGFWPVPIVVTDSASPAQTATSTLPLTIGLATGYAAGPTAPNCYMPYPTTPLYYPGAVTWSLDSSALPNPGQMFLLGSNVLTGCLTGGGTNKPVPSGNYTLNLTARDASDNALQTLALSVPVIGQGLLDNGLVNVNSGGVTSLPPSGYQQGVVMPGQLFPVLTAGASLYAPDSSTFAGNFLFGLSGGAPQLCTAAQNAAVSLTAPSAGRFDVLFNGTSQTCPLATTFPNAPSTLPFYSVDAVGSTVSIGGATVSSVSVTNPGGTSPALNVLDIVQPSSGTTIPVTLAFNYTVNQAGCSGTTCVVQIQYGLNTDATPQACAYDGVPSVSGTTGTANVTLSVPNTPGRYYVGIDSSLDYSCFQSQPTPVNPPNDKRWWSGKPSAPRYVAVVDVLAP